jgi:tRNA (mo5U34)-methyltransferase
MTAYSARTEDARTAIAEVAPGIVTPGLFDLRPILDRLPWPDVRGKRCLDVGTSDGFLAFELERRGAAEVVATDISGHEHWDWELHLDRLGPEYLRAVSGEAMGRGFEVARELRGSAVKREQISVYELTPAALGSFDVVVCGSLLLHLRDPLRALAAIRSVCASRLLCTNQVDLIRSLTHPRKPLVRLDGTSGITQWWLPNAEAHRQMLRAAGFEIERDSGLYAVPFGPAHEPRSRRPRWLATGLARRLFAGRDGVPHLAVLASPR